MRTTVATSHPREMRGIDTMVIAIGLLAYGLYIASYVPGLLIGASMPLMLIGFVLQAIAALFAAFGVWRGSGWTFAALIFLGLAIAVTELVEGFVLGLISGDHALLVAVIGIVVTFVLAGYVRQRRRVM